MNDPRLAYPAEDYLLFGFFHHCIRASTDSNDLNNELMQVSDLCEFFQARSFELSYHLPDLFAWLYKVRHFTNILGNMIDESQADGVGKEPSSHFQSLWDRYLISTLEQYEFNRGNVDIAELLFFHEIWDWLWSRVIPGSYEVPSIFLCGQEYQDLLSEFFEDKNRSGKYHVDGTAYAHAALEFFRNIAKLEW